MELITTAILLSFFSFFYYLGFTDEDIVTEIIGSLGILLIGGLWFSTGIQMVTTDTSGVLYLRDVPVAGAVGIIVFFVGFFLVFYARYIYRQEQAQVEV